MIVFVFPGTQISGAGIATSANQLSEIALLTTIDADTSRIPAQGQALMAASTPVVIASNQSAVPISAASLPLPTGAATETTLAALNTKVTAVNTGAVVVSSSALPTGAATETTLASINTKTLAAGQALMTGSSPVVIASNQSAIPASQSGTWTVQPGNTANTTAWLIQPDRSASATLANVAASATSVTLLASSAARKGATFYNDSTAILYLKFGVTASTTSFTVILQPNDYYEIPQPAYTGVIDGISSSATGTIRVTNW